MISAASAESGSAQPQVVLAAEAGVLEDADGQAAADIGARVRRHRDPDVAGLVPQREVAPEYRSGAKPPGVSAARLPEARTRLDPPLRTLLLRPDG
jgi:hypothetical protein